MPRHLTQDSIEKIAFIIDEWEGKLTWALIVNSVERSLGVRYSRQTLSKYDDIKDAYYRKLEGEGQERVYYTPREMKKALDRLDRLEVENQKLKNQVNNQIVQLARWAYNAGARGITKDILETPLPPVDRK